MLWSLSCPNLIIKDKIDLYNKYINYINVDSCEMLHMWQGLSE